MLSRGAARSRRGRTIGEGATIPARRGVSLFSQSLFALPLDAAIEARLRDSDLDREAARLLVERGSEAVDGGVCFTHDPRLRTRSRLRLTENQVLAFLSSIACPVLAVRALQGWPFPEDLVAVRLATIQQLETAEIDGGHHVHLTHPERIAPLINRFFFG